MFPTILLQITIIPILLVDGFVLATFSFCHFQFFFFFTLKKITSSTSKEFIGETKTTLLNLPHQPVKKLQCESVGTI